jgi:hypothetical protein
MVILREKQKFDEMAILVVSAREDNLQFRIAIKSPDHQPPHAHVMDLKTGKKELGQFLVSNNPPRKIDDIKNYKQGVDDEIRKAIFEWSKSPHKVLRKYTNWEALYLQWTVNNKW